MKVQFFINNLMLQDFINLPWTKIFILFCIFYVFLLFIAWFFAGRALFPHPLEASYSQDEVDFIVSTPGGMRIACFQVQSRNPNGLTILYSHGNGEDLGMIRSQLEKISESGCNVISYDYPGYGLSSGDPTEDGCFESIDSVLSYMITDLGLKKNEIILWGRSLGSGPSCYLASQNIFAGIILESPFLSAFRTVTEIPILPWDYFQNIKFAKDIKVPSLVIHGRWDEVVPFRHGKRLYNLLGGTKEFLQIKHASHNDLVQKGGSLYEESIINFINNLL